MTSDTNPAQPGELRQQLLAEVKAAEQGIAAFNGHILNHKHMIPGIAAAILVLLYLGMAEPLIQIYTWGMIGTLFVILGGVTFWKRRQADTLNVRLDAAQKAWKAYEKGRRRKRRK